MSHSTTRDIGVTLIALIGIFYLVEGTTLLCTVLAFAWDRYPAHPLSETLAPRYVVDVASRVAVGGLLVFLRYVLAKAWFPESVLSGSPTADTVAAVLFAVVGIWMMAIGATHLLEYETERVLAAADQEMTSAVIWSRRLRYLADLGIGFTLFAGSDTVVRIWHRLRATPPIEPVAPTD
jgi:hypothetical protein